MIALPLLFVLSCCSGTSNGKEEKENEGIKEISSEELAKETISALSGLETVSNSNKPLARKLKEADNANVLDNIKDKCNEIAGDVGDLLYEFDVFFVNRGTFTNSRTESDKPDYVMKESITYTQINGESLSLNLYYSDMSESYRINKDGKEAHYCYQGIVSYEKYSYEFEATLDTVTANNKTNVESKYVFYENAAKTNYVVVKSSTPIKNYLIDSNFNIEVYYSSNKVMEFTMKFMVAGNNMQLDFDFQNNSFTVVREQVGNDVTYKVKAKTNLIPDVNATITLVFKKVVNDSIATFVYQEPLINLI